MLEIGHYLMRMAAAALAGIALWALFRPWRRKRREKKGLRPGKYREWALLLLFMFLAGLLFLTLTPPAHWAYTGPFQGSMNLIPLWESLRLFRFYVKNEMWTAILVNFPGNIIMFMPIGFFAGLLLDKSRWWKSTLCTFGLSFFIEFFQLFVCRGTDVDDLILNTLGGLMGHWCFLLLRRGNPRLTENCMQS